MQTLKLLSTTQQRPARRVEERADGTVHVLGVLAALIGAPFLVGLGVGWQADWPLILALAVYGISLTAMFVCSAIYNLRLFPAHGMLMRRLDHAMIYLAIAGTYSPFAVMVGGAVGHWLLFGIWGAAVVGLGLKLLVPGRLEWFSIALYLGMGWAFVAAAGPIGDAVLPRTMHLIIIAGVLYTIGVGFHICPIIPFQGMIWHLFVLVASFVLYAAVLTETAHFLSGAQGALNAAHSIHGPQTAGMRFFDPF